jgi:hypothetical protein
LRLTDCTHLSRRTDDHVLDADEVLNCATFSSLLTGRGVSAGLRWSTVLVVLAVAAAVFGVLARSLRAPVGADATTSLRTSVDVSPTAVQNESLKVTILVANQGDHLAQDVRAFISGRSLPSLVCEYTVPEEAFLEVSSNAVCALIGNIPAGEVRSVDFYFRATKCGDLKLAAHVGGENLQATSALPIECQVIP